MLAGIAVFLLPRVTPGLFSNPCTPKVQMHTKILSLPSVPAARFFRVGQTRRSTNWEIRWDTALFITPLCRKFDILCTPLRGGGGRTDRTFFSWLKGFKRQRPARPAMCRPRAALILLESGVLHVGVHLIQRIQGNAFSGQLLSFAFIHPQRVHELPPAVANPFLLLRQLHIRRLPQPCNLFLHRFIG